MSFQGLTPEAFVERSDSKNPATTCKGLTTSGRPCRRSLAATPGSSPGPSLGNSPQKSNDAHGVVAILNEGDAAAFFCWQHKDQAQNLIAKMQQSQQTRIMPLQKRSSIDTLAEKVGIIDLDADESDRARVPGKRRVKKRETLPTEWQSIQGPLMSVPEDVVQEALPQVRPPRRTSPKREKERPARSNVKASWGCCIRADDDDDDDGLPARRRERYEQRRPSGYSRPQSYSSRPQGETARPPRRQSSRDYKPDMSQVQAQVPTPRTPRQSQQFSPQRPSPAHSQTQTFLSHIPQHLDPQTTSALLAELSKPFAKDDEAGYIYIFWLTPSSDLNTPDDDIASTILDGDLDYQDQDANSPSRKGARASQLRRFASTRQTSTSTPTPQILLKIGRAQNVHRRMTQWTKQCNQNITLVRYYPHYASKAADPDGPGGAKVPHVNRVERLIHIELRGMGMGKQGLEKCNECGREHREWFEVPATRKGLRGVDEVVRRWVTWAEGAGEREKAAVRQEGYY